jgi:predicted ATPase with chaperone activity
MEFDTPIWNERMIFEKSAKAILKGFFLQHGATARQYVQVVRVARTIADLAYHKEIANEDMAEAIQYMKVPRVP